MQIRRHISEQTNRIIVTDWINYSYTHEKKKTGKFQIQIEIKNAQANFVLSNEFL